MLFLTTIAGIIKGPTTFSMSTLYAISTNFYGIRGSFTVGVTIRELHLYLGIWYQNYLHEAKSLID
jgi:hypothetical protein